MKKITKVIVAGLLILGFFNLINAKDGPFSHNVVINLNKDNIYLLSNQSEKVVADSNLVKWESNDESIATVTTDGIITAQSVGETDIVATIKKHEKKVHVVVTDLITKPVINNKKKFLPCNYYDEKQAKTLDEILKYRINESGYKTRAGAVQAARFLTLEFPFRISYFFENGRLLTNDGERTYADGEGRYYHVGLYLHENKYEKIVASNRGPAIWGCPLYSGVLGIMGTNGLDCSGFVSWSLLNAGYDPGDGGSGINSDKDNDLDDLGKTVKITDESIKNARVGDFTLRYGHIGIIIGIDDKNFYIAEAIDEDLHVQTMSITKIKESSWKYFVFMDEFYKEDGNLTNMW